MKQNEKKIQVEAWQGVFAQSTVAILVRYVGMKSNDLNALRKACRESGVRFHVVKNNLARIALKGNVNEFVGEKLVGPLAIATCEADQTMPARVLTKFAKDNKTLEIVGGALDGQYLDAAAVNALAKMPGKNELRAQFLGLLSAVPGGFVRLLNAVPGGLVNVLDAHRRKLEEAA